MVPLAEFILGRLSLCIIPSKDISHLRWGLAGDCDVTDPCSFTPSLSPFLRVTVTSTIDTGETTIDSMGEIMSTTDTETITDSSIIGR